MTVDGRRNHLFSDPDEETYGEMDSPSMTIDGPDMETERGPVNDMVIMLGSEGYYRSSFYRLGSLRLIEVPLYAYHEAQSAIWLNEDEQEGADD